MNNQNNWLSFKISLDHRINFFDSAEIDCLESGEISLRKELKYSKIKRSTVKVGLEPLPLKSKPIFFWELWFC